MTIKRSKKITLYNIGILSIAIFMAILLNFIHSKITNAMESTIINVESQWRAQSRDLTDYLSVKLESAITNNDINYWDDDELNKWALANLSDIRNGSEKSDIIMVNLGYSFSEWDKKKWIANLRKIGITLSSDNIEQVDKFISEVSFKGLSNNEISTIVKDNLNELKLLNCNEIYNSIMSTLFIQNRIIFDEKSNESTLYSTLSNNESINFENSVIDDMTNGYDTINTSNHIWSYKLEDEWLEWSVVPSSRLGLDNEPENIYGVNNISYKKILIISTTNVKEITAPYTSIIKTQKVISDLCMITAFITFIITFIVTTCKFYKFICLES